MPSHRGNVARLPLLPPSTGKGGVGDAPDDIKAIREHLNLMTTILNQSLQQLQNRMNTVQQSGARKPPTVTGLTVTGKQGLFHLTWSRIKNADGYVVVQASDSGMTQLVGRFNIPDGDSCTHQVPVGNVAVTNSFQVYAYQGRQYSQPSPAVTATTLTYTSSEAAPLAPTFAPRQPKVAPVRSGPNL